MKPQKQFLTGQYAFGSALLCDKIFWVEHSYLNVELNRTSDDQIWHIICLGEVASYIFYLTLISNLK